jgi:hypothetical protein
VLARRTHQSRCPRRSRPPDRASSSVVRAAAQKRRLTRSSPPGVKDFR